MAYNYLDLTNEVLVSLNEVKLTSSNFSSAVGFHEHVKNCINRAISDIYQEEDGRWPFAKTTQTQVLTVPVAIPYVTEYSIPSTEAIVDWQSFRIKRTASYDHKRLAYMDYNTYQKYRYEQDSNLTTAEFGIPDYIVELPNRKWTVSTVPTAAYTIEYDTYSYPTELSAYTDAPSIPESYRQAIVDKALHYGYMFRDNIEQADYAQKRYENYVNRMRRALIPQTDHIRYML